MIDPEMDFSEATAGSFRLRSYQKEWLQAIALDRLTLSRLLIDAAGGLGKTTAFAALAKKEWETRGGRTLVLENRDKLVQQTANRIRAETGLEVDIEMGTSHASPYAPIVVASVQTLGRINRLTGFADNHFSLLVPDEAHHSTAPLFLRVIRYFNYGSESLREDWGRPKDGAYTPLAHVVATTATAYRKELADLYQKISVRYSYMDAVEQGWLVGIRHTSIPVKIDTRKFRIKRSGSGSDFNAEDESAALIPVIEEIASQIVALAPNRKTMAFLPSVECATLLALALNRRGLKSICVTGDCIDKNANTEMFHAHPHGQGIVMTLCAMYVEGADFPTVDCVAWLRATMSEEYFKQGVYRLTRTWPGIVNDDMTAEQRRAAIAASPKPWGLLIDPFFVGDRIEICSIGNLYTDDIEVKKKLEKMKVDSTDIAKLRDTIKALEEAAKKNAHKKARTVDPIKFSLSIGEGAIADYVPETAKDAHPPTAIQLAYITEQGLDATIIKNQGQAQKIIGRLETRKEAGLASPKMLMQLLLLGFPEEHAVLIKKGVAGVIVGKRIRYRKPAETEALSSG